MSFLRELNIKGCSVGYYPAEYPETFMVQCPAVIAPYGVLFLLRLTAFKYFLNVFCGDTKNNKKAARKPPFYYQYRIKFYVFLRLATPIKPRRPEANNQAAAGTGTALTSLMSNEAVGRTNGVEALVFCQPPEISHP